MKKKIKIRWRGVSKTIRKNRIVPVCWPGGACYTSRVSCG